MTKKHDLWMPLLVDKYLGDTMTLTTEQHGAYLLLLMSMWKKGGRLPDDDVQLAQAARLSAARWRATRVVLVDGALLRSEDGWIVQKRLTAELERSKASTERKAKAGAKGAAKRWQSDGESDGTDDGKAMADASFSQWQTGAYLHTPSASQIHETASAVSARAAVGQALKAGGVNLLTVNLNDPRLTALIDQGATPDEFEGLAREAVAKGIAKPLGWICTALQGRRQQAAAIALAPQVQGVDPTEPAWKREQRERMAEFAGPAAAKPRRAAATTTTTPAEVIDAPSRLLG